MGSYTVYTDGGAHNENGEKHGIGSTAWLIPSSLDSESVYVYTQYYEDTTNNRTEMIAILNAIEYIDTSIDIDIRTSIKVISDSGYVVKGYTDPAYLERWKSNGWKTSTKKPVLNRDLWLRFIKLSWHIGLTWEHIRGHKKDGNHVHAFWNDICDQACTYTMENLKHKGFQFKLKYNISTKTFEHVQTIIMEDLNDGQHGASAEMEVYVRE